MPYLFLPKNDKRILHISSDLDYQPNGNYLINEGTIAIPPSIVDMIEVDSIPESVETEKWSYIDGEFVYTWVEPSEPTGESVNMDRIFSILEGEIE